MELKLPVAPNFYSNPFPKFGKPKAVGYIGLEHLKFARCVEDKKVNFDLNVKISEVKRKPDVDARLTNLLRFLLDNKVRLKCKGADILEAAEFWCYRGLLTCIACTPYETKEPWKIVAVLYAGCIYLCARDTEEKKHKRLNKTKMEEKFCSWGYKFEQYMLSDDPNTEPNPAEPVDETTEFSVVYKTELNKHVIMYAAELDGLRCDKDPVNPPSPKASPDEIIEYLSTKEFVELKTSRHIEFSRQDYNFRRYKINKWWCQTFSVGIESILCGFRDDHGIVKELKVYNVSELPKLALDWRPDNCYNFLDSFLTYVKKCLEWKIICEHGEKAVNNIKKLPLIALQLEWYPGSGVKVSKDYSYEDDKILEDWFTNEWNVDMSLELSD